MRSLQKDRACRYQTASDFARDVQHYLAHEPIEARRPTPSDRMAKWTRRHLSLVLSTAAALLLTILALAIILLLVSNARQDSEVLRHAAEQRAAELREQLYAGDLKIAQEAWKQANLQCTLQLLSAHEPQPGQADIRSFEWHYLWGLCHLERQLLRGHDGDVCAVAFDPRAPSWRAWGKTQGCAFGMYKRARCATWSSRIATMFTMPSHSPPTARRWPPLREKVASSCGMSPTLAKRLACNLPRETSTRSLFLRTDVCWPPAAPMAHYSSGTPPRGAYKRLSRDIQATCARWPFADSTRLATGSSDNNARVWDVGSGKMLCMLIGHTNTVTALQYSGDGLLLATASADRNIIVWDPTRGQEFSRLAGHTDRIYASLSTRTRRTLVSCSKDGTIRLWDLKSGQLSDIVRGHVGRVRSVAISPASGAIASAGSDGTVRIWDRHELQEYRSSAAGGGFVTAAAFSPEGMLLTGADSQLRFWDFRHRCEPQRPREFGREMSVLALARTSTCSSPRTSPVVTCTWAIRHTIER